MFKSIKTILWATLVVSLSLGFASCSSSDDGLDGDNPLSLKTRLLPVKIDRVRKSNTIDPHPREAIIKYDASDRIVILDGVYMYPLQIVYNADGTVKKCVDDEIDYMSDADGFVISVDKYLHTRRFVDKDGYLRSYKINIGEKGREESVLTYSRTRDLLEAVRVRETNFVDERGKVQQITTTKVSITYSDTYYNPYVAVTGKRWTFSLDLFTFLPMMRGNNRWVYSSGLYAPMRIQETSIIEDIVEQEDGEIKSSVYEDSTVISYTITKSKENYPIEILESTIRHENIQEDLIYTITYQDAN